MKKKILICTKIYSLTGSQPWLIDDLANWCNDSGMDVTVLFLDINGNDTRQEIISNTGIRIICFPLKSYFTGRIGKVFNKFLLGIQVFGSWIYFGAKIRSSKFDVLINVTMFSLFYGVLRFKGVSNPGCKRVGIVWDFYPVHMLEIGKIKNNIFSRILRRVEGFEFKSMNLLCFMSSASKSFCDSYHPDTKNTQHIYTRLWRTVNNLNPVEGKLVDNKKLQVVFGGQLSKGRGFEQLLNAAEILEDEAEFTIIGDGDLWQELYEKINYGSIRNVTLRKKIPRTDYLKLLSEMDIGVVITVGNVTIPSYPSKCIDYMISALPIVAAVEDSSDFGEFIEREAKCGFKSTIDNAEDLALKLSMFIREKDKIPSYGKNGRDYFMKNMQTDTVAQKIFSGL